METKKRETPTRFPCQCKDNEKQARMQIGEEKTGQSYECQENGRDGRQDTPCRLRRRVPNALSRRFSIHAYPEQGYRTVSATCRLKLRVNETPSCVAVTSRVERPDARGVKVSKLPLMVTSTPAEGVTANRPFGKPAK